MPYRNLADFLEELLRLGEVVRVPVETDPSLELSQVAIQSAQRKGTALLFGAVKGHDFAVLTNLLATEKRICLALGVSSLTDAAARIERLLAPSGPGSWLDRLKGGLHPATEAMAVRRAKTAPCQQIVRLASDIDLNNLPLLRTSSRETARSITSATVLTAQPDSHRPVAGRFTLQHRQPSDRAQLAVCWTDHDEHARLRSAYRERGQRMPLAVVIGGDPAFLLAAAAPLPPDADLCAVAGLLRDKPLDVVACRSVDLEVPAESEFVIEGYCDPAEPLVSPDVQRSPLGWHVAAGPVPLMHVTAVTHRPNAICSVATPSLPPNEACTVARAMNRVFLPLVRLAMPELLDFDLPQFGAARHWAVVSIHKTHPGQAHQAAHAAWSLHPIRFAKVLIIVDGDVDVHNPEAVFAAVAANMNPACDVIWEDGPSDPLDPAAGSCVLSRRMALDATRKQPGESRNCHFCAATGPSSDGTAVDSGNPAKWAGEDQKVRDRVAQRWAEYGLGELS